MSLIVSSLPGRIRLRDAGLRDARRLEELHRLLAVYRGVVGIEMNSKAGSVVVRYDLAQVEQMRIVTRIEAAARRVLGSERPAPPAPGSGGTLRVKINRQAKRGMLGSLAVSLLLAAAGRKHWHALSGGLFVVFLTAHLWVHRRHLLR